MTRKEARHQKTLKRQVSKFERLCHKNTGGHSNIQDGTQHDWTNPENKINTGLRSSNVTCNLTDCRKFTLICPNLCGIFM